MMVSEKVTGDSSLIKAISLLHRKSTHLDFREPLFCSLNQLSVFLKPGNIVLFVCFCLPDEKRAPLLMHDDLSSAHEHGTLLRLC